MRKPLKRQKKADKASISNGEFVSIEVFNRLREASKELLSEKQVRLLIRRLPRKGLFMGIFASFYY
jgi:hypothetical protein